jgi:hypothetical protein
VPFVVIGHSDLLYQSILKRKRNMAHHGTQKITQFWNPQQKRSICLKV